MERSKILSRILFIWGLIGSILVILSLIFASPLGVLFIYFTLIPLGISSLIDQRKKSMLLHGKKMSKNMLNKEKKDKLQKRKEGKKEHSKIRGIFLKLFKERYGVETEVNAWNVVRRKD